MVVLVLHKPNGEGRVGWGGGEGVASWLTGSGVAVNISFHFCTYILNQNIQTKTAQFLFLEDKAALKNIFLS